MCWQKARVKLLSLPFEFCWCGGRAWERKNVITLMMVEERMKKFSCSSIPPYFCFLSPARILIDCINIHQASSSHFILNEKSSACVSHISSSTDTLSTPLQWTVKKLSKISNFLILSTPPARWNGSSFNYYTFFASSQRESEKNSKHFSHSSDFT